MTKTTSHIEREDVLLRARAEAEAELRELKRRITTAQQELRRAVETRNAHVQRHADQWTPDLTPNSPDAEAIQADIAALEASPDLALGDRVRHAEGKLAGARRDLAEFRVANDQALAEELTKAGEGLAGELNGLLRESAPALLERYTALEHRFMELMTSLPGTNGQDVGVDQAVVELRRHLRRLDRAGGVSGPYSRTMTPRPWRPKRAATPVFRRREAGEA